MKLTPQKFREAVVLFLFSIDFTEDLQDTFALVSEQLKISGSNTKQALEKAQFIMTHVHDLDLLISKYSKSYDFHRIPLAEKAILRLAFFELVCEKTLHYKVIISEAIRLARKFASPEAGGFINAILDQYVKEYFPNQDESSTKNQDTPSA
jgi:N utilization substance protein B